MSMRRGTYGKKWASSAYRQPRKERWWQEYCLAGRRDVASKRMPDLRFNGTECYGHQRRESS
ncbi:MAG: hypothetical protein KatS3mg111_2714 [Pirellulaceae bacterium]|nr:MAG: hypothetical protein KatS3mg111_2714 [Pirellulaceae bacterium]